MEYGDFLRVHAYLAAGCGKSLAPSSLQVYFDLLRDLPAEALELAAQRVLMEHPWSTFPSIAELRAAATSTVHREVSELSPGEAWALAWRAVGRIDPEQEGSTERGLDGLPASVVESVRAMGIPALCYGCEPVGVIRGQFMKVYEAIAARQRRQSLLPQRLQQAIAGFDVGRLAGTVARIGLMPVSGKADHD